MPVTNPPRVQDYDNAHLDLQTIEDVVNGSPSQIVTSRLGRNIRTLANVIQDLGTGGVGGIIDAPEDGKTYARLDGDWTEITPGGIEDAPEDGSLYARINGEWQSFSPGGATGETPVVANYAAVKAIAEADRANNMVVFAACRATSNDGAGRWFYFDEAASDTDNGSTILAPDAGSGRWKAIQTNGMFDAAGFGVIGNNSTECAANFNAALSAIPSIGLVAGGLLQMPRGHFLLGTALTVPDYTSLAGVGMTPTRLNFNSLSSGSAILNSGQDYYNVFRDFFVENAPAYAIETLDGSNSMFMNLAIKGKTTGTTSGGIRAGSNSYMNAYINVRVTDVRSYGWYNEGFTTSQLLLNYFVLGSDKTGFRWNHVVYSAAITTGSDDSLEHGHEFTNSIAVGLFMPGIERSTKSAFKFQAGSALDPATVVAVKDVKDVVVVGGFGNDCGGSGEPTAIEAVAANSRVIRALFLGYHDDNIAGGPSVEVDGTNVHILAIGGQFPGGVSATNSATFGHMKYDDLGLTFEINGIRRVRVDEAVTSFTNTQTNAYGFVFSGTTNAIGEVGLWIIPGDTNAAARSAGIGLGRHARGDLAFTRSIAQGANPSVGDTLMLFAPNGNAAIGATSAVHKLSVAGTIGPTVDNLYDVGSASYRIRQIFCNDPVIQTSDARHKTPIRPFSDAEMRAIERVIGGAGIFQWLSAVERKGEGARLHAGVTAQAVEEAFIAEGLDPARYALFCEDPVFDTVETPDEHPALDEDGNQRYEEVPVLDENGNQVFEEVEVRTIVSVRQRDGDNRETGKDARNSVREVITKELKPVMERGEPIIVRHIKTEQVRRLNEDGTPATMKGIRYEELQIMVMAAMWQRLSAL